MLQYTNAYNASQPSSGGHAARQTQQCAALKHVLKFLHNPLQVATLHGELSKVQH